MQLTIKEVAELCLCIITYLALVATKVEPILIRRILSHELNHMKSGLIN